LHTCEALLEHELDFEMADMLPHRDTLGLVTLPTITVTVTPVIGVAVATQVLTNRSINAAALAQIVSIQ
jgi:hypothetical protein